jgi:hypothetical protein
VKVGLPPQLPTNEDPDDIRELWKVTLPWWVTEDSKRGVPENVGPLAGDPPPAKIGLPTIVPDKPGETKLLLDKV